MIALWAPGLGGDLVITDPTRSQLLRFSATHTPPIAVLKHSLKGEGRDQSSGGEGKHSRQYPLWELESPTGQGTQHQGVRSDHAEENRLSHAS